MSGQPYQARRDDKDDEYDKYEKHDAGLTVGPAGGSGSSRGGSSYIPDRRLSSAQEEYEALSKM